MIFAPVRLGETSLNAEAVAADKKSCKRFGPCGVGKEALFLNSYFIDRRYYVAFSSVRRVFKRVAMSQGGFSGKGAFGAILGIGNALGKIDYTVIWRYFSWTNQTLAMIVLWAASMYLFYDKKNYWITAVPATFMSAVSVTYFLLGNECLGQFLNTKTAEGATVYNTAVAYPVGIIVAIVFLGIFLYTIKKRNPQPHYETLHK